MKVTYFYRPVIQGVFSIESVFQLLKTEFSRHVEMSDYICTTKWKRLYSFLKARKYQGDVNHITGDIHTIALFLSKKRTILTIHDIGRYERGVTGLKKFIFKQLWIKIPLRRSAAITTISEFTKQKLVQVGKISPDKIHVIYNPTPIDFEYLPKVFNKDAPVILQIGSGDNKNLNRLIEAIKNSPYRLILIRRPNEEIAASLKEYNIQYEWHYSLTRDEVYNCYCKCDILFFASEYEGFGVPILEANAVGRPVITSNVASMPEVAGDAAVIVNPYDIVDIRKGLDKIRDDDFFRESLIINGKNNLQRFSISEIAKKYRSLYLEIYEKNK